MENHVTLTEMRKRVKKGGGEREESVTKGEGRDLRNKVVL